MLKKYRQRLIQPSRDPSTNPFNPNPNEIPIATRRLRPPKNVKYTYSRSSRDECIGEISAEFETSCMHNRELSNEPLSLHFYVQEPLNEDSINLHPSRLAFYKNFEKSFNF